jgi:hypothetical protein
MFKAPRIHWNAGGCDYFLHPHPFFAVFAGFFAAGFFAVFFAAAMGTLLLDYYSCDVRCPARMCTGTTKEVLSNQICYVNKAHGLRIDFFTFSC